MISTCANPACRTPFHYLRGGRLYRFDSSSPGVYPEDVSNAVCATNSGRCAVFFWLCRDCSSRLLLKFNGQEVSVVPLNPTRRGDPKKSVVARGEWVAGNAHGATDLVGPPAGTTPASNPS